MATLHPPLSPAFPGLPGLGLGRGLPPFLLYNGFFPWPRPKAMTQDNSTGRAGLLPSGRFVTIGTSLSSSQGQEEGSRPSRVALLLHPSHSANTDQTQATQGWRVRNSRSQLLISPGGEENSSAGATVWLDA